MQRSIADTRKQNASLAPWQARFLIFCTLVRATASKLIPQLDSFVTNLHIYIYIITVVNRLRVRSSLSDLVTLCVEFMSSVLQPVNTKQIMIKADHDKVVQYFIDVVCLNKARNLFLQFEYNCVFVSCFLRVFRVLCFGLCISLVTARVLCCLVGKLYCKFNCLMICISFLSNTLHTYLLAKLLQFLLQYSHNLAST